MSKGSRYWKEFMKKVNPLRKNRSKKMYMKIKRRIAKFDKQQKARRLV